jgi:hypothetical protein
LQSITKNRVKERYTCPGLPLAVYREVAAHLRQVTGVNAGLTVKPLQGDGETFDYNASQIEALWLEYPQDLATESQQRVRAILDYYGKRYQPWETKEDC